MNISKLFRIVLCGLAFCAAVNLWAQDGGPGRQGGRGQGQGQGNEMMLKQLDLSDEQMEQVKAVLAESNDARKEILARHGIEIERGVRPDREAMQAARPDLTELRDSLTAKLSEILSEEQMAKYKELRGGNRQRGGGQRGGGQRKGKGAADAE